MVFNYLRIDDSYFTNRLITISLNKLLFNSSIIYIVVSILLGFMLLPSYPSNLSFFILNLITTAIFYIVLIVSFQKTKYGAFELTITTIIYQLLAITALTQLYISYTGVPFSLRAMDSLTYDWLARENLNFSFFEAIKFFSSELPIDDLGFPTYLALVYRWSSDPLLARYLLIIVIILISIFTYKIAQNYLSNRYAYMAAITVSISNYSVLFASNGNKELLMILILLASVHYFLRFLNRKKVQDLIIAILISFTLIFFRIPLVFFFLITVALTFIFYKGNKPIFVAFLALIILASIFILYGYYSIEMARFTDVSTEKAFELMANSTGQTTLFTIIASFVSGIIGPLPTLFPKIGKEDLSFIAGAQLLRVFLSGYIISTIYYVYKNRLSIFYPLIFYPLFTILALLFISDVFEFRFHLPHLPFLIILGFFGIENRLLMGKKVLYINMMLLFTIIYWNFGKP